MKRTRLCAALLCGALSAALLTPSALAANAPNDLRNHWAQTQVYTLMEHGIITGYPDHTFRPDQTVTRQEAVGLVYGLLEAMGADLEASQEIPVYGQTGQEEDENVPRVMGAQTQADQERIDQLLEILSQLAQEKKEQEEQEQQEQQEQTQPPAQQEQTQQPVQPEPQPPAQQEQTGTSPYADLEGSWAKDKILCLAANGVLPQDGTGLFLPFQNMTRGEAAQILYACLCRWPELFSLTPVDESPAIYDMAGRPEALAVMNLARLGVVSGRGDGGYYPDDPISRAEFSVLLLNLAGYPVITDVPFEALPACTVIPTPYISQVYPSAAWVGCEPTSLLMGLKAKGYALDVTLDQFLADMPKTSSNPAKGFVGSPYVPSETLRTTIYPAPLAQYGQRYGNVKDFSGKSVEELREEVLLGNPVVIYVTLYWKQPYYRNFNIEGTTQSLLRNNHAVLVCGYDSTTQMYYIADPYNIDDRYHDYFYWISADVLDPLYMVRQHAVAIE